MFLTLKTPAKISSKNSVCICRLLQICLITIFNKVKYRDKQCGPGSDCSYRSSLIWVYPVCWKGFSNISADDKSRRLVIGVLSFKTQHVTFFFPIQLVHHDHTLFSLVSLVELSTTLPRSLLIRPHQQAVPHTQVETQLVLDRSTIQVLEKVRSRSIS